MTFEESWENVGTCPRCHGLSSYGDSLCGICQLDDLIRTIFLDHSDSTVTPTKTETPKSF